MPAEEKFLAPGRGCSDRDCDIGIDIKSYDLPQQRASARRDELCSGHDRDGLRDATSGLASPRQFCRRGAADSAAARRVRLARTLARYGRLERLGRGRGTAGHRRHRPIPDRAGGRTGSRGRLHRLAGQCPRHHPYGRRFRLDDLLVGRRDSDRRGHRRRQRAARRFAPPAIDRRHHRHQLHRRRNHAGPDRFLAPGLARALPRSADRRDPPRPSRADPADGAAAGGGGVARRIAPRPRVPQGGGRGLERGNRPARPLGGARLCHRRARLWAERRLPRRHDRHVGPDDQRHLLARDLCRRRARRLRALYAPGQQPGGGHRRARHRGAGLRDPAPRPAGLRDPGPHRPASAGRTLAGPQGACRAGSPPHHRRRGGSACPSPAMACRWW